MRADKKKLFKEVVNSDVIRLLNVILVDAYYKNIPEIQFVCMGLGLNVFYVKKGVTSLFRALPQDHKDGIMARIKLMAGLNIAEKRETMNVSFDFDFDPQKVITFSVSLIPDRSGEKIILKLQR